MKETKRAGLKLEALYLNCPLSLENGRSLATVPINLTPYPGVPLVTGRGPTLPNSYQSIQHSLLLHLQIDRESRGFQFPPLFYSPPKNGLGIAYV
jgi:hypothetical protein